MQKKQYSPLAWKQFKQSYVYLIPMTNFFSVWTKRANMAVHPAVQTFASSEAAAAAAGGGVTPPVVGSPTKTLNAS